MKRLIVLSAIAALLALAFAQAFGNTLIYRDSTGELLYVTTVTIPGTDIITRLDTCSLEGNQIPCTVKGCLSVVVTVVKAVGKVLLKVIAEVVRSVV